MKFQDLAVLAMHSNRLQAAAAATAVLNQSLQDEKHVFNFGGQIFTGPDALALKDAIIYGLQHITHNATTELESGGIVFTVVGVETVAAAGGDAEPVAA